MIDIIPYESTKKIAVKTTLIIGAFDAIHNGHLSLINEAKKYDLPIVITLFKDVSNIPSKQTKWNYASFEIKIQQLAKLGINKIIAIKFSQIQNTLGQAFINHIKELTNAERIIVGYNFGYGKNRENNTQDLQKQFLNTVVLEKYQFNQQNVSTSLLKQLVALGEVDAINQLAPFPYTIMVDLNNDLSIVYNQQSYLHAGIYGVFVEIDGIRYWGAYYCGLQKAVLKIPDFTPQLPKYHAKLMIITNIRYLIKDTINLISDEDLVLTQNKLASYLKNRI